MKQDSKNNIIDRLMTIVSHLARSSTPERMTEIARELKLSKTTTFRILHRLEKGQWVTCDPDTGMYKIGTKMMEIGLSIRSNTPIVAIVMPFLTELRDTTNETVGLSIRVDNERIFIEEMQSNRELRFISPLGRRLPLWAGAVGKAILANLKETEKTEFFNQLEQQGLPAFSSGKTLDINELLTELVQIQKDGCAVSIGEREKGTSAVASPIFDIHNEVIGAVNIAGPTDRFRKEVLSRYSSLIKRTADFINQKTGSEIRYSG